MSNAWGSGCLGTVGWMKHEGRGRGLGGQLSRPTLPSSLIGCRPAGLAPMRCIVGFVCGSPPVLGKLPDRGGVVFWSWGLSSWVFFFFKNVAETETVTVRLYECGAKSRRIPSRGGWRRVQSGGAWRRCVRSWTWTNRLRPKPWRTSLPYGTHTLWR